MITLISINTFTRMVRAYSCAQENRLKVLEAQFDRLPDRDEVEGMRRRPETFLDELAAGESFAPVGEAPTPDPEPSVA